MDLSALTDDQLVELMRLALAEAARRTPAVQAAMDAARLDAEEAARIAHEAADREAAILRAEARAKAAKDAARAVREAEAARNAEAEATRNANKAAQRETRERDWLQRAADLIGRHPSDISIYCIPNRDNRARIVVNHGSDRYDRDHLVDWTRGADTCKMPRAAVRHRAAMVALCVEIWERAFAAEKEYRDCTIEGSAYHWEHVNA